MQKIEIIENSINTQLSAANDLLKSTKITRDEQESFIDVNLSMVNDLLMCAGVARDKEEKRRDILMAYETLGKILRALN